MSDISLIILSFSLPFLLTSAGALLIFCFSKPSPITNTLTIGLASGIMISASIWSLLVPAVEGATTSSTIHPIIPVGIGFLSGTLLMLILDVFCNIFNKTAKINIKLQKKYKKIIKNTKIKYNFRKRSLKLTLLRNELLIPTRSLIPTKTNPPTNPRNMFKLFSAITFHNIPEGLSVGFAIGSAIATNTPLIGAFMFALGISLQNFPEGLATAIPIQNCTKNKKKAFLFGVLSGIVEPIFSILGFFLASQLTFLQPWLLSISAGAMIYATIKELLPEIYTYKSKNVGLWSFIIGFLLMMTLDICL